jgi:hypothetical protein
MQARERVPLAKRITCAAFVAVAMGVLGSCGGGATVDRAKDPRAARGVERQIKHLEVTKNHLSKVSVMCVRSGENKLDCGMEGMDKGVPVRASFRIVIDPKTGAVAVHRQSGAEAR